jgi:membrane protein implicated in regulation of membrane protease activity
MLTPTLKEVSMGERVKCLAPAALVTVLDAAVAMNYGGMVWKVLSGIIWTKLLLLLLASVWATTLLHVWFHACSRLRHEIEAHPLVESIPTKGLSAELAEEIDV